MKNETVTRSVKIEKMVRFIKNFDHYQHKFNFSSLFQPISKTVKGSKFNQNLDQNLIMTLLIMVIYTLLF